MRRRWGVLAVAVFVLVALAMPAAGAQDVPANDVLGNIAPPLHPGNGMIDRYPISAFSLDVHVDGGLDNPDGTGIKIIQFLFVQLPWMIASWFMKIVIDLFGVALHVDLFHDALGSVANTITSVHANVLGINWLMAAIAAAGIWGIWHGMVKRDQVKTIGGLATSVMCVVAAMFFVFQPVQTVGGAAEAANQARVAFLTGSTTGSLSNPDQAINSVRNRLFEAVVYHPWLIAELGGLTHCVDGNILDGDGYPLTVPPGDQRATVCRDHVMAHDGWGGYAPLFLAFPPGSKDRNAVYEAIRDGKKPEGLDINSPTLGLGVIKAFQQQKVDKADSTAVYLQQYNGTGQRVVIVAMILILIGGAVMLLGWLALGLIVTQVVALLILAFSPVALVLAALPFGGHRAFRWWLMALVAALAFGAFYALVLGIVANLGQSVGDATAGLGFLRSFGLECAFYWIVFLKKRRIGEVLGSAVAGVSLRDVSRHDRLIRQSHAERMARIAMAPVATAAVLGWGAARGAAGVAGRVAGGKQGADGKDGENGATGTLHSEENGHTKTSEEDLQKAKTAMDVATIQRVQDPRSKRSSVPMPADSSSPPANAGREQNGAVAGAAAGAVAGAAVAHEGVETEHEESRRVVAQDDTMAAHDEEHERTRVRGALSSLDRDDAVHHGPGRTSDGELKDFRKMRTEALVRTSERLEGSDDHEARDSVTRELRERYEQDPLQMDDAGERAVRQRPDQEIFWPSPHMTEGREREERSDDAGAAEQVREQEQQREQRRRVREDMSRDER